jgi:hypothetical protein
MKEKSKGSAAIFLVVLLLIAVGGVAYYFGTKNVSSPSESPRPISSSASSEPVSSPSTNWKTFTTKDGRFSFQYPSDWNINDNSKEVDLYQDGKFQLQHDVEISRGSYKINSYNPLAWGPGACLFPDSPEFEGPSGEYETYVQFESENGIFRRTEVTPDEKKGSLVGWTVCTKDVKSEFFVGVAGFGSTSYETPLSYDEEILKIMDSIVATIKSKPQ